MATRSVIAWVDRASDGGFNHGKSIYAHFDGYPMHMGVYLAQFYNTQDKARGLIEMGDMASIEETVETCEFYHRDQDEEWDDVQPIEFKIDTPIFIGGNSYAAALDEWRRKECSVFHEYAYVFFGNHWIMRKDPREDRTKWTKLQGKLKKKWIDNVLNQEPLVAPEFTKLAQ